MKNFFENIENYPGTTLDKYGDFYELFLKKDSVNGGLKISGNKEQIQNYINFIINNEKIKLGRKN